jgi:hypothetical protein
MRAHLRSGFGLKPPILRIAAGSLNCQWGDRATTTTAEWSDVSHLFSALLHCGSLLGAMQERIFRSCMEGFFLSSRIGSNCDEHFFR